MKTLKILNQNESCCSPKSEETTSCCTPATTTVTQEIVSNNFEHLPVAIIGAGPIGLAAAAHLVEQNQSFVIFESGSEIASNIRMWGHVTMFSPWRYNIDKAANKLLEGTEWQEPNLETIPTGHELIDLYLKPLSELPNIKPFISLSSKVVSVSRLTNDKMKTKERLNQPFVLYVESNGDTKIIQARAVIDATGTWGNPNPANSNGVWLQSEKALASHIDYGIPEIATNVERYAGKKVAVIGGGHSAINTLLGLANLQQEHPSTQIVWIMRKRKVEDAYGGEERDALAARGALGTRIHKLVDERNIEVVTPFHIAMVKKEDQINIIGTKNGEELILKGFDELIVNTGNRPDFTINSEVRLSIDPATESITALAPLIDPNEHSCGTVRAHGEEILRQPELGFYIVGMKSYGRAPTFLLATGYEQVRSITAFLAGDIEASKRVELDLPETGVCSLDLSNDSSTCC